MIGMILMVALQITLKLLFGAGYYALMAYVVAYVGRKGWEAGKKSK